MERKKIRKEIADLINSIKEHSDNLSDTKHIPQLELEAILHKIEQLYEKSIVFNYLHLQAQLTNSDVKVETEKIDPVPEKKNEVVENTGSEKIIVSPEVKVDIEKPSIAVETTAEIDLFGNLLPPSTEKTKTEKKIEKKEDGTAVKKITKPAITDIKAAIGLNDRFQFCNELFDGNITEYNIAIENFNSSENLESAMEYFNSLQHLYNWDMEKESAKRLLNLVERRYS